MKPLSPARQAELTRLWEEYEDAYQRSLDTFRDAKDGRIPLQDALAEDEKVAAIIRQIDEIRSF